MSAQMPPTGPGPVKQGSGRSTLPLLLALGAALGAGYYLMNPSKAEQHSQEVKETTQNYGNKFDKAFDSAFDKAKEVASEQQKAIEHKLQEGKTEAQKAIEKLEHKAEETAQEVKAKSKGWFK